MAAACGRRFRNTGFEALRDDEGREGNDGQRTRADYRCRSGSAACHTDRGRPAAALGRLRDARRGARSEEHTSELQSLMRISYAVFCLKKHIKTTDSKTSSS